jgi:hypothetical protein
MPLVYIVYALVFLQPSSQRRRWNALFGSKYSYSRPRFVRAVAPRIIIIIIIIIIITVLSVVCLLLIQWSDPDEMDGDWDTCLLFVTGWYGTRRPKHWDHFWSFVHSSLSSNHFWFIQQTSLEITVSDLIAKQEKFGEKWQWILLTKYLFHACRVF